LKLEARQDSKRKVEVFSAGCALCEEVIDVVRREAGSSSEVIVHNMKDARALARAEELGIRSVPAVVVDGRLASRAGGGVDIQALKRELGKTPKGLILST
jgi:glutaredoxin